jgi:pilus assembly protein CpaB
MAPAVESFVRGYVMLRLLLLALALIAGGAAAWIALALRSGSDVTPTVEAAPKVVTQEVLVASIDLGPGEAITKDSIRWQSWPEGALHPAYITRSAHPDSLETLAGSIVRSRIIAGDPVRNEKLVPTNASYLSTILPAGKRAIGVRISAENTAGGFILPSDRVDVLHTTVEGFGDGAKTQVSRTILRNVPVLAIDQSVEQKPSSKSRDDKSKDEKSAAKAATVGRTATLELDPQHAEILMAAEATGTLSLALRSAADNAEPPVASLPQARPSGGLQRVQIVRGGRSENVPSPQQQAAPQPAAASAASGRSSLPGT